MMPWNLPRGHRGFLYGSLIAVGLAVAAVLVNVVCLLFFGGGVVNVLSGTFCLLMVAFTVTMYRLTYSSVRDMTRYNR